MTVEHQKNNIISNSQAAANGKMGYQLLKILLAVLILSAVGASLYLFKQETMKEQTRVESVSNLQSSSEMDFDLKIQNKK